MLLTSAAGLLRGLHALRESRSSPARGRGQPNPPSGETSRLGDNHSATPTARLRGTSSTLIGFDLGWVVSGATIIMIAVALSWAVTRAIRRIRLKAQRTVQALYLLEKLA